MYRFIHINQIIDFLIHDDTIEDDSGINLFCPESTKEEKDIIEYYVTKYCCRTPAAEDSLVIDSNFEVDGQFYVDINGFDYTIDFEYIIH